MSEERTGSDLDITSRLARLEHSRWISICTTSGLTCPACPVLRCLARNISIARSTATAAMAADTGGGVPPPQAAQAAARTQVWHRPGVHAWEASQAGLARRPHRPSPRRAHTTRPLHGSSRGYRRWEAAPHNPPPQPPSSTAQPTQRHQPSSSLEGRHRRNRRRRPHTRSGVPVAGAPLDRPPPQLPASSGPPPRARVPAQPRPPPRSRGAGGPRPSLSPPPPTPPLIHVGEGRKRGGQRRVR